jgi:hypothetical protein
MKGGDRDENVGTAASAVQPSAARRINPPLTQSAPFAQNDVWLI